MIFRNYICTFCRILKCDVYSFNTIAKFEHFALSYHSFVIGRSGLEALSVLVCACIMTFISIEIIQFSMVDILNGINGDLSPLKLDLLLYVMIFICMILKSVLFMICSYTNLTARNDMLLALTEDHFNDVISNSGAIITATIAFNTTAWWADPGGAILISIIIIYRWTRIMTDQVKKLLGHIAPPHFILKIEGIARLHDSRLAVNCTRAYHFGAKYNVEMEITLPGSMMIFDLQDITLALKQKLEAVGDVERAFIIVGHQIRNDLEQNI